MQILPRNLQNTHTNEFSSPVAWNNVITVSTPSTCTSSSKKTFILNCKRFMASFIRSNRLASQNKTDGLIFVKIRTISSTESIGNSGQIGQFKPVDANTIGSKFSLLIVMKQNFSCERYPIFCKFCAARIDFNRISSKVICVPVSSLIWKDHQFVLIQKIAKIFMLSPELLPSHVPKVSSKSIGCSICWHHSSRVYPRWSRVLRFHRILCPFYNEFCIITTQHNTIIALLTTFNNNQLSNILKLLYRLINSLWAGKKYSKITPTTIIFDNNVIVLMTCTIFSEKIINFEVRSMETVKKSRRWKKQLTFSLCFVQPVSDRVSIAADGYSFD